MSNNVSPKRTVVNMMLQPEKFKAENRPPSCTSMSRYQAKSLHSNEVYAALKENLNASN